MRSALIAAFFLLCTNSPVLAGPDGSIEIFYVDPETHQVEIGVSHGSTTPIHAVARTLELSIQARLAGRSVANFAGAEFYLGGLEELPPGWNVAESPAWSFVHVGFFSRPHTREENGPSFRRFNAALDIGPEGHGCGSGEYVEIARLQLVGFSRNGNPLADLPADLELRVVGAEPTAYENVPGAGPLFVQCDYPIFTLLGVTGGRFLVNPREEPVPLAVSHSNWSAVKQLYR